MDPGQVDGSHGQLSCHGVAVWPKGHGIVGFVVLKSL